MRGDPPGAHHQQDHRRPRRRGRRVLRRRPAPRRRGHYYAGEEGEAVDRPGRWVGALALSLGLRRAATSRSCSASSTAVTRSPGSRWSGSAGRIGSPPTTSPSRRRVGLCALALADNETQARIEQAHQDAADEALGYVVRHLELVRRGDGGQITETAAEVAAMSFLHHSSRQTEARALHAIPPDPQLHTHILLALARRQDSELVAINSAAVFRGRQEAEAVYHAALAARLQELGFKIQASTGRGRWYFEVAGIPAALREDSSSTRSGGVVRRTGATVRRP
jgi:hypothetical protein